MPLFRTLLALSIASVLASSSYGAQTAKRSADVILKELVSAAAEYDRKEGTADSYKLYEHYHAIGDELLKVVTRKDRRKLLQAFKGLGLSSSARPLLLQAITQVGDIPTVTHLCIQQIRDRKTPDFELYESVGYIARRYVLDSPAKEANDFLIKVLKNPQSDEELRCQAYWHVAQSGSPGAVKAVKAERAKRVSFGALESIRRCFFGTEEDDYKLLATKTLNGKTWGLLEAGPIGNRSDLWLAEKQMNRWVRPLFTGVSSSGISSWVQPPVPEPTVNGLTGKQLVAANWWEVLVGKKEISLDSDGDGLTNLVEKRLGTNALKTDTDGDGIRDGADPFPNAARMPQTEDELVMAAAFEAHTHFDSPYAAILTGEMDRPVQFAGRCGPTIWLPREHRDWSHPLEWGYEQGVGFIRVSKPKWTKKGKEATVQISIYFGGLSGSGYAGIVRKIGNDWFVVKMYMEYIS